MFVLCTLLSTSVRFPLTVLNVGSLDEVDRGGGLFGSLFLSNSFSSLFLEMFCTTFSSDKTSVEWVESFLGSARICGRSMGGKDPQSERISNCDLNVAWIHTYKSQSILET